MQTEQMATPQNPYQEKICWMMRADHTHSLCGRIAEKYKLERRIDSVYTHSYSIEVWLCDDHIKSVPKYYQVTKVTQNAPGYFG